MIQKVYTSVPKQFMNGLPATHVYNTEPAQNPLAAPEFSPKPNFATSPKRNFDHVNCSDDQTTVSSTRPVSALG